MVSLIPSYTYDLNQLWQLITRRNRWLIRLRYGAVAMIIAFIVAFYVFPQISISTHQRTLIYFISFSIIFYNIVLSFLVTTKFVKNEINKFNPIHVAVIQMLLDLVALLAVVYYTGTLESPFYIFFIFHMIIGSMLLAGQVIYSICAAVVFTFFGFVALEFYGVIPHYAINGFTLAGLYRNPMYVIISCAAFAIMMGFSVFLANSITSALYRREQELSLAYAKLNEAEIMKQKYIMGIVHEIKTPIVAVQSHIDLVLGKYTGPISEQAEDKLKRARKRCEEATEIINDILNISKLKLLNTINKSYTDITKIIQNIISQRNANATAKNITIEMIDKREIKKDYFIDAALMELALSNLIGNSVKYTNPGGKVEIIIYENNDIEIRDNGIGIPEEDIDKIFNDFYRASNVKEKVFEGTGLGLSLVKQIIEQHGGTIDVHSPSALQDSNGKGTSFIIHIN